MNTSSKTPGFSHYEKIIIAILAILQFTVILDFMVLSPLGAHLIKLLSISPQQFGIVVSAYAFSAGASGLLAAGFADKFDRKRLLLFFYTGFIIGTFFCGIAPSYELLLAARIVTGIFGGVISSITFAIITDLFALQYRGRVMGFVQTAFAASQVLGIPLGLYLANKFDWHAPFLMITGLAILIGLAIVKWMKPIDTHLELKSDKHAFLHLIHTLKNGPYLKAFLTTAILATGGYMLMPFGSAYLVNNVKLLEADLPLIFMTTGIFSILTGPIIGKLSDQVGKFNVFVGGTIITMIMVVLYTNLPVSAIWKVMVVNTILFVGIMSRIISSSALMTAVPKPQDRGVFMGINASIQQISGGIASLISGLIVIQPIKDGPLQRYNTVGYIVIVSMVVCAILLFDINKYVTNKLIEKVNA